MFDFSKKTIGIAGAGGIGSNVASSLVRSGVNKLVIADFDVVQESNLNRQFFFHDQINEIKVNALTTNLLRINKNISVKTFNEKITKENITKMFNDVDILVEAFDKQDQKAMLIKEFKHLYPHKPIITISGLAGIFSSNKIITRKLTHTFYVIGDLEHEVSCENPPLAPRVLIAANHAANLVLELIHGEKHQ